MPIRTPEDRITEEGRARSSGGTVYLSIPGVETVSVGTSSIQANRMYYEIFYVSKPIIVDQMLVEVSTAATGNARLGIYNADKDWQPTTLIIDAGTVDVSSTGVKTLSLSPPIKLRPGRYLKCIIANAAPTLRVVRGGNRYLGHLTSIGSIPFIESLYVDMTYGSLPNPGTKWTAATGGGSPFMHRIFLRVITP